MQAGQTRKGKSEGMNRWNRSEDEIGVALMTWNTVCAYSYEIFLYMP